MSTQVEKSRRVVRSIINHQRGFVESRDGVDVVVLDMPGDQTRPYRVSEWEVMPDETERQLNEHQIARCLFELDRQILRGQGRHHEAKRTWESLPEREQQAFLRKGIPESASPLRARVYKAALKALSGR